MSELDDGLSEYERKRASIIAANKAKLAELMPFAMDDAGPAARKTVRPSPKRAKTEYAAQPDRPKRAVRSKARHPYSFPADHFWPDPMPKIRKPERRPESRGSSSDKMSDRLEKSMYFNSMQIGDTIRVVKNTKCGHHDVTNKHPGLEGQVARIMSVPIYPSTWLAVELVDTGKVVKIRTSQMRPLDRQADGTAAPLGGRVVGVSGASAPVESAESPEGEDAGATDSVPVTPNKLPDDLTADADAANGPLGGTPAKQLASAVPAAPASSELITVMMGVYTPIVNMKSKHGDTISEIFMELPSKEDYPDYYEIIEVPLGFGDIEKKIKAGGYPDLTALTADFYQVFANAHHYNESGSVVYNYATILKSNVTKRMKHARETLRYQKLEKQAGPTANKVDETSQPDAAVDTGGGGGGGGGGGSDASDDDDDAPIELNRTAAPAVVASAAHATVPVVVELSATDDAATTEVLSPVAPGVSAPEENTTADGGSTGSPTSPAAAAAESDGDTDDDDMPIDFNCQSATSPAIGTAISQEPENVPMETEEENKEMKEDNKDDDPQVVVEEDEEEDEEEEEEEPPVKLTATNSKRSTTTLELVDVDTIAIVNVRESTPAKARVQKARKKSRKADKPYSRSTAKQNAQPVTESELVVA